MTPPRRPPALLEEFEDDGHVLSCVNYDFCDCRLRLLDVARATRRALERDPVRMMVTTEELERIRLEAAADEWPGQEDPLILIRQLRAQLAAMTSPSRFGKGAPVTGLDAFGRVLDQLQAFVLEWGAFALEHPDRVTRPT